MPKTLLALLFAAAAGCVVAPPRVDPFAGLTVTGASYRELTVALVPSENTKNALRYTNELGARGADAVGTKVFLDHRGPVGEAADKTFTAVVELFQRQFKAVVKTDSPDGARAVGADLVAVLDIVMDLPHVRVFPPGTTDAKIDLAASFLGLDGGLIETVSASASRTPGFPRVPSKMTAAVDAAREQAVGGFGRALLGAAKLAEFAKGRSGAPAAAAAPAAPAAPARASAVDRPSYRFPPRPDDFAVVVGIESYDGLPPAQYAERDARAVREHLLALGYPERNVAFLTGKAASSAGLKKHLETWLPNNVTPDSTVLFYYSGHGAPDPVSGKAYLVPTDGDPQYLPDTAYPIARLYETLGALKAKRVVVAMDACFSGAGGRSVLAKGVRPLVTTVEAAPAAGANLVALSASGGDQVSGTADGEGHGLFTYFLLKGLNDSGGKATVRGLYDGLRPKVQDHARRENREQTPQLTGAGDADAGLR